MTGPDSQPGPPGPVSVFDGGDEQCVQLLRRLVAHVRVLPPGTVVRVHACDPAAPLDLPAWCHLVGHQYLGQTPTEHRCPAYLLQVAAKPRATGASPWRIKEHPATGQPRAI